MAARPPGRVRFPDAPTGVLARRPSSGAILDKKENRPRCPETPRRTTLDVLVFDCRTHRGDVAKLLGVGRRSVERWSRRQRQPGPQARRALRLLVQLAR